MEPKPIPSNSLHNLDLEQLSKTYLELLLSTKRYEASTLILNAIKHGVNIKDIYLNVFQKSQHEIGYLWQTNQISVAQEHFCTAATQMIMSQLYPHIFNSEKKGLRMVATCVGGELHEIGLRMVTDFFEMAGWDTYYLGASTPTKSIIETIESYNANVLAISAAMTFHINATRDLISEIKNSETCKNTHILVGGRPFNLAPDLWKKVNADGYAQDAQKAIDAMETLFPEKYKRV